MLDPHVIFDLLLQEPRGWIVLAAGGVLGLLLGMTAYRRLRMPRSATHALIGSPGKLGAQTKAEVDSFLKEFRELDVELMRINSDLGAGREGLAKAADRVMEVSTAITRECDRLDTLNIAFVRDTDHREFVSRITAERDRAQGLHKAAMTAKRRTMLHLVPQSGPRREVSPSSAAR